MKLDRKITPVKHVLLAIPALLLVSYNSYSLYNRTNNEYWLYAIPVMIAIVAAVALILRKPLVSISNGKITISGQTIATDIITSSRYIKNRKAPDIVVIKMDGFEPHEIPVGRGNADVGNLRVYHFIKQALPDIELDESK